MLYIPDTHALVWYITADKRLGKQTKAALLSVDAGDAQAVISVLVLAEIMYLGERGRIDVKLGDLIKHLQLNPNYAIAPLTLDTILIAKKIKGVPELFDRMIAATAVEHDAVLLTQDSIFHSLHTVKTIW